MSTKPEVTILNTVYQSAAMGSVAVENLLDRTDDVKIKEALSDQLEQYHKFETQALDQMHQLNETPADPGTMKKMMSRMGIRMNTAIDRSPSHLAEMVIQGSTMGITDLQAVLNCNRNAPEEVQRLCSSLIHHEQNNINRMKPFLGV